MAVYLNQAQIDLIRGRACIVYLRRQLASTARRRGNGSNELGQQLVGERRRTPCRCARRSVAPPISNRVVSH